MEFPRDTLNFNKDLISAVYENIKTLVEKYHYLLWLKKECEGELEYKGSLPYNPRQLKDILEWIEEERTGLLKSIGVDVKEKYLQPKNSSDSRIRCKASSDVFITMFEKMKGGFIHFKNKDELELILSHHFKFEEEPLSPDTWGELKKIVWVGQYTERLLIYFVSQLIEKNLIHCKPQFIGQLIETHFCHENGEPYKRKQISDQKRRIKEEGNPKDSEIIDSILNGLA